MSSGNGGGGKMSTERSFAKRCVVFGINKFPARCSDRSEMGTVEYHHPHFTRRGWHEARKQKRFAFLLSEIAVGLLLA